MSPVLAFRSFIFSFAVILPGIFLILAAGDILWALGDGLQFASVVALTLSFGLGLSTIHFLNRRRLECRPDASPAVGIERATVLIGPALVLTSVVLACGLAATIFSNLPLLRMFVALSAFATMAALLAELLVLRPIIMFLYRLSTRMALIGTRSGGEGLGCVALPGVSARTAIPEIICAEAVNGPRDESCRASS